MKHPVIYSVSQFLSLIDGVSDLIDNFNDIESSKQIINELLRLYCTHNLAIVTVLHTIKGVTDHEMRDHIGTMLAQKSSTVPECEEKEEERNGIMLGIEREYGGSIERKKLLEEVMKRTGKGKTVIYKFISNAINSGTIINSDGIVCISDN